MKAPIIFGKPAVLTENLGNSFIVWTRYLGSTFRIEIYRFRKTTAKRPWGGVLLVGASGHVALTHGRTRAEAVRNIEAAVRGFFAAMRMVRLS